MTATALSAAQIGAVSQQAGFSGGSLQTAIAIALAESGGNPAARHVNVDGSVDRGIFQINNKWHPGVSDACAYDPVCAAQQAFGISSKGTNFNAWTTFTSGAYKSHLEDASLALGQLSSAAGGAGASAVAAAWALPFDPKFFKVLQGFGPTRAANEPNGFHTGIDYAMPQGTPVYAMAAGVIKVNKNWTLPGYPTGWAAQLQAAPGFQVIYGHLSSFAVADGASVQPGQLIGYSGGTPGTPGAGDSGSAHLHLEVDQNGKPIDPTSVMGSMYQTASSATGGASSFVTMASYTNANPPTAQAKLCIKFWWDTGNTSCQPYITNPLDPGNVAGGIGNAAGDAAGAVAGPIIDFIKSIGARVALFVLGVVILGFALYIMFRTDGAPTPKPSKLALAAGA